MRLIFFFFKDLFEREIRREAGETDKEIDGSSFLWLTPQVSATARMGPGVRTRPFYLGLLYGW